MSNLLEENYRLQILLFEKENENDELKQEITKLKNLIKECESDKCLEEILKRSRER